MDSHGYWREFLHEIEATRQRLGCGRPPPGSDPSKCEDAWFRGLTKRKYQLMPSLFRYYETPNDATEAKTGDEEDGEWFKLRGVECDLFYEFSARAREVHGPEMTDWDILFAMQHHGTPTRLLDWTEALGIAVFFACEDVVESNAKENPVVWVMNPFRLNRRNWLDDSDLVAPKNLGWEQDKKHPDDGVYWEYGEIISEALDFGWEYPVAIYPRQQTNRMHAQKAWFTIHGDEHISMEDMLEAHKREDKAKKKKTEPILAKVELPRKALPAARQFLEDAGINIYSVYPDLNSLSKHLKQKYGLLQPRH